MTKIPRWAWPVGAVVVAVVVLFGPRWVGTLRATSGAVSTYSELIVAANRQDLTAIRQLCTKSYLETHPVRAAKEGGVIGLPRNIDKNFQAWREGDEVFLCPTNRVGPVYRFVSEDRRWKFDGPAGVLRQGGQFFRSDDSEDGPAADAM